MRGIDFARYLSIWLLDLHQTEERFWYHLNPAKLHRLADARQKQLQREQAEAGPKSLSAYLMGGE